MFHLSCLIDDPNVPVVLRAIKGLAYNVECQPMDEEPSKKGKHKKGKHKPNGVGTQIDLQQLAKHLNDVFTTHDVSEELQKLGRSGGSAKYIIDRMIDQKIIRKAIGKGPNGTHRYKIREVSH